jgi:Flp pilus assembly protein TadG
MNRILRDRRGNAAVEFALILPILLLMLGGIIDFGRGYWYKQTLTWASRVGARQASMSTQDNWDVSAIKQTVVDSVEDGCAEQLPTGNVTVDPDGGPAAGTQVTVTVTMPFSYYFLPYSTQNLTGQTTMNFESL